MNKKRHQVKKDGWEIPPHNVEILKMHAKGIASILISQISNDGKFLVSSENGAIYSDIVSQHHVLEFLVSLDGNIFNYYIRLIINDMLNTETPPYTPFFVDAMTNVAAKTKDIEQLIDQTIIKEQLKNGAIPIFTTHVRGGDYFSTLWAAKILIKADKGKYSCIIEKAIDYLLETHDNSRTTSQTGFLLWILSKYDNEKYLSQIRFITQTLLEESESKDHLWFSDLTETVFLLIDFLTAIKHLEEGGSVFEKVGKTLFYLFDLSQEEEKLPFVIEQAIKGYSEPLIYETFAQLIILVSTYLHHIGDSSLRYVINGQVQGNYLDSKNKVYLLRKQLKEYLDLYSRIHNKFDFYNSTLEEIWETSHYDRSIFIMMPFQFDDEHYCNIHKAIKDAAKEEDFSAFLSIDTDRKLLRPTLWENLVVNMLSCKYGIAVITPQKMKNIDPYAVEEEKLRISNNANVSLEIGFMMSRGLDVLLLTHNHKELPADLQGFLVEEFMINKPYDGVFEAVKNWLKNIKKHEGERKPQRSEP